jgi:dTDP-4-amino-4,6-dideoxygalactose transaminase
MFHLILPSEPVRQALIEHLKKQGILSVFHYLPLHLSVMGERYGGKKGDCPVTEDFSKRLLRLPFYNDLTQAEQDDVISAILDFKP